MQVKDKKGQKCSLIEDEKLLKTEEILRGALAVMKLEKLQ